MQHTTAKVGSTMHPQKKWLLSAIKCKKSNVEFPEKESWGRLEETAEAENKINQDAKCRSVKCVLV